MANVPDLKHFDRDYILAQLWGDPIAAVAHREIPVRLRRGDEYVDLQDLDAGVQRADSSMSPTGGMLSRKAVLAGTWAAIIGHLSATTH